MITLHTLPKISQRKAKRLGRGLGSGAGAKSGRGTTRHQAARENIKQGFEGGQGRMTKKFPLLRGKGRNRAVKLPPLVVSTQKLKGFKKDSVINIESLIASKIVPADTRERGVKIVSGGKLEEAIIVDLKTTKSAAQIIIKAGGQVKNNNE